MDAGSIGAICDVQVIDSGIILHQGSYLREIWNIMDAVVVICAAVSFTFDMMWVPMCKTRSEYLRRFDPMPSVVDAVVAILAGCIFDIFRPKYRSQPFSLSLFTHKLHAQAAINSNVVSIFLFPLLYVPL